MFFTETAPNRQNKDHSLILLLRTPIIIRSGWIAGGYRVDSCFINTILAHIKKKYYLCCPNECKQ